MASKLFYRGSEVGDTALDNMLMDWMDGASEEEQVTIRSNFYSKMHDAIQALDNRLWWQPETSEIFYEDNSDRPLPFDEDGDGFREWWDETTTEVLEKC